MAGPSKASTDQAMAGRNRRETILAAALQLFAERGVSAVTTRQIAAQVGISQPSLYAHFATKQDLLDEVCARAFQTLADRMRALGSEPPTPVLMRALARAYIRFGLENPDAYKIAFMSSGEAGSKTPDAQPHSAGLETFSLYRDQVVEVLKSRYSRPECELKAQSGWAALHGLVSLWLTMPEFPWSDRNALLETHLDLVCQIFD